jgi:hypothetical protein
MCETPIITEPMVSVSGIKNNPKLEKERAGAAQKL